MVNKMKLSKDKLYLVKRNFNDPQYLVAYPLLDMDWDLCGWWDQNMISQPYFDDDIIIESIESIEGNIK